MRRIYLFTFFFVCCVATALAQEPQYEYVPLVREGVKWIYFYDAPILGEAYEYALEFHGTKTINGKVFSRLVEHALNETPDDGKEVALMRQEGARVYQITDNIYFNVTDEAINERVIYDFGDMSTVFNATYTPTETLQFEYGTEEIQGKTRKVVYSDGLVCVIDAIGSPYEGVYNNMFAEVPPCVVCDMTYFGYVVENNEIIYYAPDYDNENWQFFKKYGISLSHCDFNYDHIVNVGDISLLYDSIIGGKPSLDYEPSRDLNGDGEVNVGDISTLYSVILRQ